jgi:hypothetical protein
VRRYPSCSEALDALARGLDDPTCHDFQGIREVVMCRAWQDFRSRSAGTFHDAVESGWQAVRSACAAHGGTTPEHGFLEAIEAHEGMPRPHVTDAFEVRDQHGMTVGVVAVLSDGTATACVADHCTEYPTVSAAMAAVPGAVVR